jgi:hypothetical protein
MKIITLLIFTFIFSLTFADIRKISTFKEADISQLTPNSLVIFDVDEVLIAPADAILTPSGWNYKTDLWPDLLKNRELFSIVLKTSDFILIDPEVLQFIEKLKKRNISYIALTACRTGSMGQISSFVEWRIQQLDKLGVKFNFFYKNPYIFKHLVGVQENAPVYQNGILFTGDFAKQRNSKGKLLVDFLEHIDWKPDHVIFFDDRMYNLTALEEELAMKGISYQGYHFLANFDQPIVPEVVDLQMNTLLHEKIWLSDEKAKLFLRTRSVFGVR